MPVAAFGSGYDPGFLGLDVPHPDAGDLAADLVEGPDGPVLTYTHFSLVLSRSRRLTRWVAWNIDGETLLDDDAVSREGVNFRPDPRIPEETQTLDDVYRDNPLDRGHVARRRDLLWGGLEEAQRANEESFTYTNICPQMQGFNQSSRRGLWGLLEDAVLAEVRLHPRRISVYGGPVLHADDPAYRGTQVPREYWKVLAYRMQGALRARAFLLTQSLDGLERVGPLDEFRTYAVPLDELAERTGLGFPSALAEAAPEARTAPPRRLLGLGDVDW